MSRSKNPQAREEAERFRTFVIRRPWLHGPGRLLSDDDYASVKARDGRYWDRLTDLRRQYLLGYIDGHRVGAA